MTTPASPGLLPSQYQVAQNKNAPLLLLSYIFTPMGRSPTPCQMIISSHYEIDKFTKRQAPREEATCARSRPGCPTQPGPLQTREPTSPWQSGPRSHTSALARVKHELTHLELLTSSWRVLHSYIRPNFPTPRIDPSLRNPSTCSLWGKAAHILPGGGCTMWSQFSPFLTQGSADGAMGEALVATIIPAADSLGFCQHHTFQAQHGSKVPQAVAAETSLIMQMCHGTSGDSILSIMST